MLPQLILILGACITSTVAQARVTYRNKEILDNCFEYPTVLNGQLYVNGQKEPLANTLENFISLTEKLELANPLMKLEEVLFILLENYTAENVYYQKQDDLPFFGIWDPIPPALSQLEEMWEPNMDKELPEHIDPFESNEKCSLFFMLSRTVNDTARPLIDPLQKPYSNGLEDPHFFAPTKTNIPREQGVVAVNKSKTHSVALGRVLVGLYVGLKTENERMIPIDRNKFSIQAMIPENIESIDVLYFVTLADQLIFSQYPLEDSLVSKKGLGGIGKWGSVQVPPVSQTDEFPICPTVYELPVNSTSAYTFSSVRGGVDGLILGDAISDIYSAQQNVRLSQILRMYYGRNGLQESSRAPPSHEAISYCKRTEKIATKEDILMSQMRLFLARFSKIPKENSENVYLQALKIFEDQKRNILKPGNDVQDQCRVLDENKGTPTCEAGIEVIFVADTTNENDLDTQQEIIGRLANHLDMGYGGSTMTVFSDQRNGTYGLGLLSIISNTTSSAYAACSAIQFQKDDTAQAEKHFVIQSISEILRNVEQEEKNLHGIRGKVVIFFNFNEEETVSYQVDRALRDLYMKHDGVEFFAVGSNKVVLKTYTKGQLQNVLSVSSTQLPSDIAATLALKICEVPSKLQYEDCKAGRSEGSAVYEGLISPNSIQRWAMQPKYFFKSLNPKMFFQSENRLIEVCQSRAYSRAEDQKAHCLRTNAIAQRLQFNATNPCRGFNDHNCAPWYFTVQSVEENSEGSVAQQFCQDTNTLRCKTLDQGKFKVFHEGIRCSSCSGLFSSPSLLLACFAAYILKKVMSANV